MVRNDVYYIVLAIYLQTTQKYFLVLYKEMAAIFLALEQLKI
jgi:hypothetical protein